MYKTFLEYVQSRSPGAESPPGESQTVTARITLGDGNDLPPFVVSDDGNSQYNGQNSGLASLIRAFKKGANWGWSRDDRTGEDKPVKMGGKRLYLTGGALRDHLLGKRPRNIELATNASPDETYHVLSQNGFKYIKNQAEATTLPKCFWVTERDARDRPYAFGVKVRNDVYELSVFARRTNGDNGKIVEPGSHQDDAASRDFTMNAMYLLLSNDDGPNKELFDFHGGVRDLLDRKVQSVGDLGTRVQEDPVRALRYARLLSRYGDADNVPEQDVATIKGAGDLISSLKPEVIFDEFLKGMGYEDIDPRTCVKVFGNLGLLEPLFPGMKLDTELPATLREIGDRHAPLAWMLRSQPPEVLQSRLNTVWRPQELQKVVFLVKLLQKLSHDIDPESLEDLLISHTRTGLPARRVKVWATRLGGKPDDLADAFIKHAASPRVQVYVTGTDQPTPPFADLADPFTGELNPDAAQARRRELELGNFRRMLQPGVVS